MARGPGAGPKLLTLVRRAIRLRHYSRHTEEAYVAWVRRGVVHAKEPGRVPVVLTREEVRAVLGRMQGTTRLVALLLYGSGLRLLEALTLRVKDIDFGRGEIVVRRGKGARDRVTMLPQGVRRGLGEHLGRVERQYRTDLARGAGYVELPGGLARKLPTAGREWVWQWVFPASRLHRDEATGEWRRHHLARERSAAGSDCGGPRGGYRQARDMSHAATFVRHAAPRDGSRHPDGAGAVGS